MRGGRQSGRQESGVDFAAQISSAATVVVIGGGGSSNRGHTSDALTFCSVANTVPMTVFVAVG